MKCPVCAIELPDDAKFCSSCGSNVKAASEPSSPHASASESAAASRPHASAKATPAQASPKPASTHQTHAPRVSNVAAKPAPKSAHRTPLVIGGVVVIAIVAAIAAGIFLFGGGGVSDDTVRTDVANSSIVSDGFVNSTFTNEESYELADFKVNDQTDVDGGIVAEVAGFEEAKLVTFEGSIKNSSYESTFSGQAYYGKMGDSWFIVGSPDVTSSSTTPLKGVDSMGAEEDESATYSNFSSTLTQNEDGTWKSDASVDVSYEFWFGTDSAKNTRSFTFDPESGWQPDGEITASDLHTTWNLSGKSFDLQPSSFSSTDYNRSSTITFDSAGDSSNGEALSAHYTLSATYTGSNQYYRDINLEGDLVAEMTHEFGQPQFEMELNDADNDVTITLRGGSSTQMVAGSGEVNALDGHLNSNVIYFKSPFQTSYFQNVLVTYTENV